MSLIPVAPEKKQEPSLDALKSAHAEKIRAQRLVHDERRLECDLEASLAAEIAEWSAGRPRPESTSKSLREAEKERVRADVQQQRWERSEWKLRQAESRKQKSATKHRHTAEHIVECEFRAWQLREQLAGLTSLCVCTATIDADVFVR